MSWFSRKPPPPEIPKYEPVHVAEVKPKAKDEGIVVEELDASGVDIRELQSRTGIQRVFDRVTGKFKG